MTWEEPTDIYEGGLHETLQMAESRKRVYSCKPHDLAAAWISRYDGGCVNLWILYRKEKGMDEVKGINVRVFQDKLY